MAGDTDTEIIHRDDQVVAFRDNNPNAPVHLLVVPVHHHPNLDSLSDQTLLAHLLDTAKQLGESTSTDTGYRIMINSAKQAEIDHLHVHVLGGLRPGQAPSSGGGDHT